jgi:hypothetical protein
MFRVSGAKVDKFIEIAKKFYTYTDHPCPSKGGELRLNIVSTTLLVAQFPSFGGAGVVNAKL